MLSKPSVNKTVTSDISTAYRGKWDASSGEFPTKGTAAYGKVEGGNWWIISTAGTIGVMSLSVGDLLIATITGPRSESEWTYIRKDLVQILSEYYVQLDSSYHFKDGNVIDYIGDFTDHAFSKDGFVSKISKEGITTFLKIVSALIEISIVDGIAGTSKTISVGDGITLEVKNNADKTGTTIQANEAGKLLLLTTNSTGTQNVELSSNGFKYTGSSNVTEEDLVSKAWFTKDGFQITRKNTVTGEEIILQDSPETGFILEKRYINDSEELKSSKVTISPSGRIALQNDENLTPQMGSTYPVVSDSDLVHKKHLEDRINQSTNSVIIERTIANETFQSTSLDMDSSKTLFFEIHWMASRLGTPEVSAGKMAILFNPVNSNFYILEDISTIPRSDFGIILTPVLELGELKLKCEIQTSTGESGYTSDVKFGFAVKPLTAMSNTYK